MSLTSALRPTSLPFASQIQSSDNVDHSTILPLQQRPNYLALSRMLIRYQNLILLTPSKESLNSGELTPLQRKVQVELWSPLPYHRMKWIRNIEGARTILLQLERSAQDIKVQRSKKEVTQDLAEKRAVIKRLRARVEEISREVEATGSVATLQSKPEENGETLYDVLQQHRQQNAAKSIESAETASETHHTPKKEDHNEMKEPVVEKQREGLLNTTSAVRRRQGKEEEKQAPGNEGSTSGWGFSNLPFTEKSLLAASCEHEDIAASLVSMAAQLKQQARQFQFTLDQDKGLLDRALEGLDQNVSAMGLASKGMGTLKRMSEEQGYLGRLKLYAFIFALWVVVILFVFVGPKLRF